MTHRVAASASVPNFCLRSKFFSFLHSFLKQRVPGRHTRHESNNISAAEIRSNYEQRLRQAQENEEQANGTEYSNTNDQGDAELDEEMPDEPVESTGTRKRKSQAALKAIKAAKQKKEQAKQDGDARIFNSMASGKKSGSLLPGQLENCEYCKKRFTVTSYSKSGSKGGLLCPPCSKREELRDRQSKKSLVNKNKRSRRQNVSKILDGIVQSGAPSLVETCIKKVADHITDVDEFGDLPPDLILSISHILSKRRALTSLTLDLFLRGDVTAIDIYDCGKLEEDDFHKIFATTPYLERVNLRFAGQLKDKQLEYMMNHNKFIKHIHLDASNLISNEGWQNLFKTYGSQLESLKLSNLDYSLDDKSISVMAKHCTNLRRLKLKTCWLLGDDALSSISTLSNLEHLSLDFLKETSAAALLEVVDRLGPNLQSLSLSSFKNADDTVLDMIHQRCRRLSKLRFSDNCICTDTAFALLFTDWENPPLTYVDVSGTRDVDNANPNGPEDPVGLASAGFQALMNHSGKHLETLNICSCRHISHTSLSAAFDGTRNKYPCLREFDISFHTSADDFLVLSIFKSCPALRKVIAFACFGIRDVSIPPGVALIGGLNAHHTTVQQDTMKVVDQMF
ncbi:DNA repair protein Rad7 [Histoplasma capsulatum]|uniref:DNA repair protein Rad7 n=1 Tax=Ajellomyces capsulatus TaxID=5037 RepID=A0A8A1M6M8_AJECA|nr:DNA repair protein Rad7 [Histoplasma capsulatum]